MQRNSTKFAKYKVESGAVNKERENQAESCGSIFPGPVKRLMSLTGPGAH